jgi:DNA invertase Pin-like site-specific DNA recombinase
MPYKSEKLKLDPSQDRRRKLTEEQKEEIRRIYKSGVCGTRPLAKQFCVSRSTIQVIVNPNIAERHKQYRKEHWRNYRPSKEEWSATMREHRNYKHELYLKGELKTIDMED